MKPTDMSFEEIMTEIEGEGYCLETQPPPRPMDKWGYCLYDGDYLYKWGGARWKTELAAAQAALEWIRARKEGKCTFML